jgi:phytoene dehydrogenase-like protein
MRWMREVVVVGSGHNALVAACYLARDGLDVEVVNTTQSSAAPCRTASI